MSNIGCCILRCLPSLLRPAESCDIDLPSLQWLAELCNVSRAVQGNVHIVETPRHGWRGERITLLDGAYERFRNEDKDFTISRSTAERTSPQLSKPQQGGQVSDSTVQRATAGGLSDPHPGQLEKKLY